MALKGRLVRVASAGLLAVAVALPTTAQRASAVDPFTVITVVKGAYDTLSGFFGGGLSTQQAVDQIKAAITQAKNEIISEIDLVAAANVNACAQSAVINFKDIDALTPDSLQSYAFATTDCVTLANSLLPGLSDLAAVDHIGFALQSVAPLAIMARAKAGLTTDLLRTTITAASNTTITRLAPTCTDDTWNPFPPGEPFLELYHCVAYDGTVAEVSGVIGFLPVDYVTVENQATAHTSRAIAQKAVQSI